MENLDTRLKEAVKHFWITRENQSSRQGSSGGERDRGSRSAVTGGKQMDGFINLVRDLLLEVGIPDSSIFFKNKLELPGYFRSQKEWDLLVIVDNNLLASIEFKSQVGSFGNNFNNRTEEALGCATDIWAAYREGAFKDSQRPWLGYFMILEEAEGSIKSVGNYEPHFPVFDEFRNASYAKRYEILLTKLVRERLYDSACFLMSDRAGELNGYYRELSAELSFQKFASSFLSRAIAFVKTRQ